MLCQVRLCARLCPGVAELLFGLLLREVFEFRLVQTEPNFAHYRYDMDTQQLILLDVGAPRPYKVRMARDFRRLISGPLAADRVAMAKACMDIGCFDADHQARHQEAVPDVDLDALEPFCKPGPYNFSTTDQPQRGTHLAGCICWPSASKPVWISTPWQCRKCAASTNSIAAAVENPNANLRTDRRRPVLSNQSSRVVVGDRQRLTRQPVVAGVYGITGQLCIGRYSQSPHVHTHSCHTG